MNSKFSIATGAFILLCSSVSFANNPAPALSATPVATASVAAPVSTPTPAPLTADEKKKLISEFQKAVSNQKSALAHQEKSSMKELIASQSMKKKKWREEQRNARHDFFDQHKSGPERRDYVQSYLKNKEAFDASIKAEFIAAKKAWMEKSVALRTIQKDQDAKFNAAINQGIRPDATLWPK